jgi:hypothetical protein
MTESTTSAVCHPGLEKPCDEPSTCVCRCDVEQKGELLPRFSWVDLREDEPQIVLCKQRITSQIAASLRVGASSARPARLVSNHLRSAGSYHSPRSSLIHRTECQRLDLEGRQLERTRHPILYTISTLGDYFDCSTEKQGAPALRNLDGSE